MKYDSVDFLLYNPALDQYLYADIEEVMGKPVEIMLITEVSRVTNIYIREITENDQ